MASGVGWDELSASSRAAFEFAIGSSVDPATASEGSVPLPTVTTESLLVGILATDAGSGTPAEDLLEYFQIPREELSSALLDMWSQRRFPFDPSQARQISLSEFPRLTANVETALEEAQLQWSRVPHEDQGLPLRFLFGGLLRASTSRAFRALDQMIERRAGSTGRQIRLADIVDIYPDFLRQDPNTRFRDFLRTRFGPPPITDPPEVRYEQVAIARDFWTTQDTVGYRAYADAIARGIQHPESRPPLTIGIKAPWGAGKTSLMRMVQERLEWPGGAPAGDSTRWRPIHLTDGSAEQAMRAGHPGPSKGDEMPTVTVRAALRSVRSSRSPGDPDEPGTPTLKAQPQPVTTDPVAEEQDQARWRPTVWFNPWMYQSGEQVWAGLAHEIITQITRRMSRGEREHFWLSLNAKRVDEDAVRRKIYRLVLERALPFAVLGIALLLVGFLLIAVGAQRWLGATLAGIGPASLLVGGVAQTRAVLRQNVSGSLSELVAPATAVRRFASDQFSGAVDDLMPSPDYVSRTGFFYLVRTDMQRVLDLIATPNRPLVVFVDDLDRCAPSTVVQVIEAINLFLAGEFPNCIFVMAMEPAMVAAHIEAAYDQLVAKLQAMVGPGGQAGDLGWRFLEKIVQLPLTLPSIDPARTTTFFEGLFGAENETPVHTGQSQPSEEQILEAEEQLAGASLSEAVTVAGASGSGEDAVRDAAIKEAARRVIDRRLEADTPEVKAVIAYAGGHLDFNPREVKRFVNLFRFFVMINVERRLAGLPGPTLLDDIAKLAILSIRWPDLLGALAESVVEPDGRQTTVFEKLEGPLLQLGDGQGRPSEDVQLEGLRDALSGAKLSNSTIERLLSAELWSFMRSEPRVGAGAHGYL
jgi:KAP family P-loop domain